MKWTLEETIIYMLDKGVYKYVAVRQLSQRAITKNVLHEVARQIGVKTSKADLKKDLVDKIVNASPNLID